MRSASRPSPGRSRDLLFAIPWRRSLLVLAPVCVLGLVSAAVIHGVLHSGKTNQVASVSAARDALDSGVHGGAGGGATVPVPETAPFAQSVPAPTPGRYQDYEASLTVRVKDVDTLHDRTAAATRLARSYGGYVASVDESSAAGGGESNLVLRIPVARVEDAYFRLAQLGTVTGQHLAIRDLDQVVQAQRRQIVQLKVLIARIGETLKSSSLPADVRLRLQLQRDAARQQLARVTGSNKATLREASFSRISLTLTAQQAAAVKKGGMSRIERAARDAGSFLAGAGAVLLFVLIVISPLLVLAVAAFFGLRGYRRREERRLLSAA